MPNCLLAQPNIADTCTLSGGAWTGALPLTNLQNRILLKKARSADLALADTQFDIALPKPRSIRVIAAIAHNLSPAAQYRLRASATAGDFSSPLFDSGWTDVWPVVFPSGSLPWGDPRWWTGKYLPEDIAGYNWNLIRTFSTQVIAQYWRLELSDATNSAGYVDIGRLFLSSGWQPATNLSYGNSLGYETKTGVEEALGGAEYFDHRPAYRVARFQLDYMSVDEAMANALEMQRVGGIDGEVLYIFDPSDTTHLIRRSFLGRARQLNPIEFPYFNNMKAAFEIKELL